jgi:hypothetical protein
MKDNRDKIIKFLEDQNQYAMQIIRAMVYQAGGKLNVSDKSMVVAPLEMIITTHDDTRSTTYEVRECKNTT